MTNKKKTPTWLTILILTGLGISVSPHQVLTQTAEVSRALSPLLSSYEVIRMEPGAIEQQVRTTGELRFRFNETDFYFNLEPHNMRAPNYLAVETGPGGVRRTLPPQPVHTFKGVLAGREDTRGRFNLTDGGVEGVVYAPEGWYYVEPLRNYLPSAPAGELVVYRHSDIKTGEALKCSMSLPKRLQRGVDRVAAQSEAASTPINYVFDVATEADYEYVQALGGSENARSEIEGILNQVEGVYQSELLLRLRISYQNTWGMADDPYTATNTSDLLREFEEYWNTHYADTVDYDIAHLWTDRERDDRGIAGRAWRGVTCSLRSLSYGLSTWTTRIPGKYVTPAHEIGHNFGAVHPDEVIPPITTCTNTVMSGAPFSGGTNKQLTFCQFSREQISEHVATNNSCLVAQDITLQPPTGLTATATSASSVSLAWQDSSINETGFIVQRRREGSGVWIQVGATAANVRTFSVGGLFSENTYIFRVQAINDEEYSPFSNEASATTHAVAPRTSDWIIDTIAGSIDDGENGPAIRARLTFPTAVAVDRSGNIYIADWSDHRIRRVDPSGNITTVAGTGKSGYSGDRGPAVDAQLSFPNGVAVDSSGNLYVADAGNNRIRRVNASGIITTIAGTGSVGYGGDGGSAVEAQLDDPRAVVVDAAGNLYITQTTYSRIRRVDASGNITTVATVLRHPRGVAVDDAGNLYIADLGNHRVQRVDTAGTTTTVAGTGKRGFSGDGGPAVEAQLDNPHGVVLDSVGNLYISGAQQIRRVDASGTITTIAGVFRGINNNSSGGYSGDGGPAIEAELYLPRGLAFDGTGNLYIADTGNFRIRRVNRSGTITTIAGIGESGYSGDGGPAVLARLYDPAGVTVDGEGNLYIADSGNHSIRRVDGAGTITTVAGTGTRGNGGDGGPAIKAQLSSPKGVAVDGTGNLYIADTFNHQVRRVDHEGIITTVTSFPTVYYPRGVAVIGAGNLYIADEQHHRILRLDGSGTITTVAGTGASGYSGDGGPAVSAHLYFPRGVAVDGRGDLYIADTANDRIRRVDGSGIITTVAGTGDGRYSAGTGPAVEATLHNPNGVAVDSTGAFYIADRLNNVIWRVDGSGISTTIAGSGRTGSSGDGGLAVEAELHWPRGIAVDNAGNVYVADTENHRIRVLTRPPRAPTRLMATAVSSSRIKLAWQDNSTNEKGFRIERRGAGTRDWIDIGTVAANLATFLDEGLKPLTAYHYRVQVFGVRGASSISNEAQATTLEALPPTLIRFSPTQGSTGTRVTLTGTKLFEATSVEFNGVSAPEFEIVSGTSIEVIVPHGATSGPISVVAPEGRAVSADPFTVTTGIRRQLFVPIVLRSQGRTPGSFFTSELALTNRGTTTAIINYAYTAAIGTGSGTAEDSLQAGRQRVIPDAIAYLTSLGVPIGSGAAGGTLVVNFSNLSSPSDAAVTVRVSTPVEEGHAGLAFPGLNPEGLLTAPAFITGLRQNSQDRSNVAVQNAGGPGEGEITLRVTVYSGDPEAPGSLVLPDLSLPPGGFHQYNRTLTEAGFDNGYVKVERVEGTAPYYAYGVINDNFNSDGSFVFPVAESSLLGTNGQTLPVIVENRDFASELTVTNFSPGPKTVDFRFVAEAVETDDETASFSLRLEAGEQRILPQVVDWLRQEEVAGIGAADEAFVGAVFATVAEGDMSGIVMAARTGSPDKRGGQYSLFYNGVPYGTASTMSAWIYGLQQNEENRSNVALVNTGEVDDSEIIFEIDIYDGEGGSEPRTVKRIVGARGWLQLNGILGDRRQGYVRVRKAMGDNGNNPFITYGVINDGGKRGQQSGDGAFLLSQE